MQKLFMKLFLVALLVMFMLPRSVSAMPEILPLDQVKEGMVGKAYTVVDSSGKIENFDVNIVGVTNEGKGAKRFIMARASGELIKRTGGILRGMSGSPIYVDGKLIGALSLTLKEMDPKTFFITPIEDMLELWTLPDTKAKIKTLNESQDESQDKPQNESQDKSQDESQDKPQNEPQDKSQDEPQNESQDEPKNESQDNNSAPVEELGLFYSHGFDTNGANFLRQELGLINLTSMSSNAERGINLNVTLEPGAALGAAIVYGDFSLSATGTVTAVDGNKILGFGHPFTHAGNVNYFMTDASVLGPVSGSISGGVKLANTGNIIGRINQDRESGVAGILGTFPAVVPVNVTVKDNTLDKQETFNTIVAYNENLVPKLGAAIAYSALSRMADSLAESTVEIEFSVKTDSVSEGKITRKNMFYNASDVGKIAVVELLQALDIVCSNTREESNIFGVDVNISFDSERRTASIVSITPDKKSVKPGETVNLTVELQPYRKPVEKIVVPYTVPLTARHGNLSLELHGGSLVPVSQTNSGLITADSNKSYEDKIKAFLKVNRNNQLIVEIGSTGEMKTEKQLRKEIAQAKRLQARLKKEGKTFKRADTKIDTNYIIDNVMRTTLSVEKV